MRVFDGPRILESISFCCFCTSCLGSSKCVQSIFCIVSSGWQAANHCYCAGIADLRILLVHLMPAIVSAETTQRQAEALPLALRIIYHNCLQRYHPRCACLGARLRCQTTSDAGFFRAGYSSQAVLLTFMPGFSLRQPLNGD